MNGRRGASPPRGAQVLSWLREEGRVNDLALDEIRSFAERMGCRIEDAVVETGTLPEAELLKLLAARYGTRFVSTDRLARATVEPDALSRIPHEIARRLSVFPILIDRRTLALSIVVAAPSEDDVEKQVQVLSRVREVRSYVALPGAIDAAIRKHYEGDPRGFAQIKKRYEVDQLDAPSSGPAEDENPFNGLMTGAPVRRPARPTPPPRPPSPPVPPPRPEPRGTKPLDGTIPAQFAISAIPDAPISREAYVETLGVFVTLLERDRDELRGHSVRVAQTCRRVAERVGMSPDDTHALIVAAHLHDVAKGSGAYHLTPLNVARYEGHRTQARRSYLAPVKLFAGAGLSETATAILTHLYERWDGQGFPDRLKGKDIPYGARVLALAETYADLIGNSNNPYRRTLSTSQALSVLRDLGGQLFDPTLAEVLVNLAIGAQSDDTVGSRRKALVVDPDPEETTVLELRLLEHGFAVDVARDFSNAMDRLSAKPELVLTEVDLGSGPDGFELAKRIQALEGDPPALIFLTSRSDRDAVSRGFDLGAADYLVKPANPELVATKARQAIEGADRKRGRGVSGSLREMSLPDVVQILANGRRGGRLQITCGGNRGEIHFANGQIHDAKMGDLNGENAFYAMLRLEDGSFSLDPSFTTEGDRVIQMSPEGLLLEGMRRLDEGIT
ncbi:MAG: HD domain-containing phosphohydrolase [Sandaracinaceae bacterium]